MLTSDLLPALQEYIAQPALREALGIAPGSDVQLGFLAQGEYNSEHFLESYCAARPDLDPADIRERLRLRRPFILLRALSWCASAWVEYTGPGRAIDNQDTLRKIEEYLQPPELAALFAEWLDQR